jgi:general L-amino acid transport system substrate-binding protein
MRRTRLWITGALSVVVLGSILLAACQPVAPAAEPIEEEAAAEAVEEVETQEVQPVEVPATVEIVSERLKAVKDNGVIRCGVNSGVPGFGFLNEAGDFEGFDIDFCKALAVAIFNDPEAVEYRPLTAAERFTALQTNEIDVLIRNTTWTLTRDTELGADFAPTTYYDGQGFIVRADSGVMALEDLDGATVCVLAGTTTELNLADEFAARGLEYTPLVFDESADTASAYEQGRCDALTSDKSQLAGLRSQFADPEAHVILPETISKEPLGPVVAQGDQQWADIVRWVVNGLIIADELDVTSENVDDLVASDPANPDLRRLLGLQDDMGLKLGLENDCWVNTIREVGNYGEIYDRHLTPLGLERAGSLNALWTEGGILYAPPMR